MSVDETKNPKPDTEEIIESPEDSAPVTEEDAVVAAEVATTAEESAEEPADEVAAEPDEALETPEEEVAAEPEPEVAVEEEPEAEEPEEKVETDYLSPDLLDSIAEVTPEQLHSLEASETAEKDRSLEELVSSSVGDIQEDKVITGRVIGMNEREILVDIGFKSEGIVPREEFGTQEIPQIGEEILVYLVKLEDFNGQTVLSKEKADFMRHWAEISEKSVSGETILGRISRRIKGGMIVDLGGVPAFLPGSQIDIRPVQDFDDYIGREFEFKIVKLNEARKNIVLSRKELLEADLMEKRSSLIAGLEAGQILEGRVKNITDFGVFVDLGGLDGLLHITDLSWGRVGHPSEVVNLDEMITIKVIDFDPEKQRVSLGLKQLTPHPWETVDEKYPAGAEISGKVVSMTNYGAFVEIEKGVEGLVHVSEMSWTRHVRHPSEMFTLGQAIEAKILNVDTADRKISLGIKQLQPDPWDQIEEKYHVGSLQKGHVRNLTQFGAFVELEEGIDGLIHITDLSWTLNVRHPKEILTKGDEVEVRILDVSRENRRIALGLKQVGDDPWDKIEAYFTTGKQLTGEVFRLLEKGVILRMEMDMEGIIPLREIPKRDRRSATAHLNPGDILKVTVQELSVEDKKIVLMPDALFTGESAKISSAEPAAERDIPDEAAQIEEPAAVGSDAAVSASPEGGKVEEVPAEPAAEEAASAEAKAPKKAKKSTKKSTKKKDDAPAAAAKSEEPVADAPKKPTRKATKAAKKADQVSAEVE
ncbi:MAG: 30S ribosomal protein S1, partial [Candidatus Neomarinimicrobiota bacterium]